MKIIFVVNPKAGKGKGIDKLKETISKTSETMGIPAGFYMTKGVGDAEAFARVAVAEAEQQGEEIRLIACGGDGTLNEVVNGIMGHHCASVGVMPIGTGNDFVRNFPYTGDFLSVADQLRGKLFKSDVMEYKGVIDGKEQVRYCANMFNIGFDCNVADLTAHLKEYPFIKGSFAYLAAVAGTFVKKKGAKLQVEIDGRVVEEGDVLLTAIANGGFCGGGVNSAPKASLEDGLMDVNIVYNVTRRDFLRLFPHYSKGTHMELPDIEKYLCFKQCKTATITPLDKTMRLCADGEIYDAEEIHIKMIPSGVNFLLPVKDESPKGEENKNSEKEVITSEKL